MKKYEVFSVLIVAALSLAGLPFLGVLVSGVIIGFFGRRENGVRGLGEAFLRSFVIGTIGALLSIMVIGAAFSFAFILLSTFFHMYGSPFKVFSDSSLTKLLLASFMSISVSLLLLAGAIGGLGGVIGFLVADYLASPLELSKEK